MTKRTAAVAEQATEREAEERLLAQLIEECGEAARRETEARSAHTAKREQVAALLGRLHGENVAVEAAGFRAMLQRRVEHYIQPEALFKVLKAQRDAFFDIVTVPLGKAKAALTPAAYADLEKGREAAVPTLSVRRINEKSDDPTKGAR
jgi:hypothetical protein